MSDFPGGSMIQNSPAIAGAIGDVDSVPGSGKSLEEIFLLPTSLLLPEKSHGQRGLVGYSS